MAYLGFPELRIEQSFELGSNDTSACEWNATGCVDACAVADYTADTCYDV